MSECAEGAERTVSAASGDVPMDPHQAATPKPTDAAGENKKGTATPPVVARAAGVKRVSRSSTPAGTIKKEVNLVKQMVASATPASTPFNWAAYLEETDAVAAPRECFFQPATEPENLFEVGKKLMINDPRGGEELMCLGTVIQVYKMWMCVRLDGTDNMNDRWITCDDLSIKPILMTRESRAELNPPVGYLHSLSSFHKWIDNSIRTGDDGEPRCAPEHWFKPISTSLRPRKCMWEVGMKCEAVDVKNFSGAMSPATIVNVDKPNRMITINFDGWSSAYDVKEPYDSRALFPIGWSEMIGVSMTPPKKGGKGKAARTLAAAMTKRALTMPSPTSTLVYKKPVATPPPVAASCVPASAASSLPSPSPAPFAPRSRNAPSPQTMQNVQRLLQQGHNQILQRERQAAAAAAAATGHRESKEGSPHSMRSVSSSGSAATAGSARKRLAEGPDSTPLVSQKLPRSAMSVKEEEACSPIVAPMQAPSVRQQHAAVAPQARPPATHVSPCVEDCILSCDESRPIDQRQLVVHVSPHCRAGSVLDSGRLGRLPRLLGPGALHHTFREAVQLLINAAGDQQHALRLVEATTKPPAALAVTADVNGFTKVRYIPVVRNTETAWYYLRSYMRRLGVCENLYSEKRMACPKCPAVKLMAGPSLDSPPPVSTWSIDKVCEEMGRTFPAEIVNKFRDNQIDGRALLLLKTELLMKHLDMPFGPALNVVGFVEAAKKKSGEKGEEVQFAP